MHDAWPMGYGKFQDTDRVQCRQIARNLVRPDRPRSFPAAGSSGPPQAELLRFPKRLNEMQTMKKSTADKDDSPSRLIDARIKELDDWRGKMLSRVRALIKQADPEVVEEWKWRGVPVWSHDGIICTGETYKSAVKLTFAKGASLKDPSGLFNSSLEGKVRRAIDVHEGEKINDAALKDLIRAAVDLNVKSKKKPLKRSVTSTKATSSTRRA